MNDRVAALIAGYRREHLHRRLYALACRLTALFFSVLYLYILIGLGHDDVFYLSLTVATIVTALSGLVVVSYFEIPQVVRALHDPDPALADDAWAAIEALRADLLPRLSADLRVAPDEAFDRAGLVRLTAGRLHDRWRRLGPVYLAVYLALLAGFIALLVAYEPETLR